MKDKRELLKNGTFGVMTNGKEFVIVNDTFVYKEGGFDNVSYCNEDLELEFYNVEKLIEAKSFNNLNARLNWDRYIIYDREKEENKPFDVVCVDCLKGERNFTIGKIYTWDRKLVGDDGFVYSSIVTGRNPEKWKLSTHYKFIKIVK